MHRQRAADSDEAVGPEDDAHGSGSSEFLDGPAIFLFHATALVFFSSFPAFQQRGDALYYANYFADRTFNPFVPYPIVAIYFVMLTLVIIVLFGAINRRLNRHLPAEVRPRLRIRPNVIR